MDVEHTHELTIEHAPTKRDDILWLTAKQGDKMLHADEVRIMQAKERQRFAKTLRGKVPSWREDAIEEELLQIVTALRSEATAPEGEAPEVELSQIVRPDRFINAAVSGLAERSLAVESGKPAGRWKLYLRWADGRREVRDITESLKLADGGHLWFAVQPSPPSLSSKPGWSSRIRRAWEAGAQAPDPAELLSRMLGQILRYVDLPEEHRHGAATTLALWVILTYIFPVFEAVPYIYLGGPAGSGKSRTLEVLGQMVFRPLPSSNMSAACLFRTLDQEGGTLLLDEAEGLRSKEAGELRSILLSGYKRGSPARRLEPVDDSFRPRMFDVFGPKALACIDGLPPALASRCITLNLFRCPPGSAIAQSRVGQDHEKWQSIRDDLHMLALENADVWLALPRRTDICPPMSGRHAEIWQPLLALADWFESCGVGSICRLMQEHARASIKAGADDQTPEVDQILLELLTGRIRQGEEPTAHEILEEAQGVDPAIFAKWSASGVGRHLGRYGIKSTKSGERRYRGVTLEKLRLVQDRYGIDLLFIESGGDIAPESTAQPVQHDQK